MVFVTNSVFSSPDYKRGSRALVVLQMMIYIASLYIIQVYQRGQDFRSGFLP